MTENLLVPDGITPVVGWRAWKLINGQLQSIHYGGAWESRKPQESACHGQKRESGYLYFASMWTFGATTASPMTGTTNEDLHLACRPTKYNKKTGESYLEIEEGYNLYASRPVEKKVLPAPMEGCNCGVYAARSLSTAIEYEKGDQPGAQKEARVLGRVALWGKVIVYDKGWRGQYAYPQAIYLTAEQMRHHKDALSAYGVPILLRKDVPELAVQPLALPV